MPPLSTNPSRRSIVIVCACVLLAVACFVGFRRNHNKPTEAVTAQKTEPQSTASKEAQSTPIPLKTALQISPSRQAQSRPQPEANKPRLITMPEPKGKVTDRYASMPEVMSRTEPPKKGDDLVVRVRLIRDASFKYPLLRVRDELRHTDAGDVLVKQQAMVADHLLVKLKPGVSDAVLVAKLNAALKAKAPTSTASVRRRMPTSGLWLINFTSPDLDTIPLVIELMNAMPELVALAEPDYIAHASTVPNDTYYSLLWGLNNDGASNGVANMDINAPEAWDLHTGSKSVVVGCIDTGVDYTHQDLAANIWVNTAEIPSNGIDDDNNGYIDDVRGWDFVNADNDPRDDHYHGTHTAGTIGAVGNNNEGVTGVCWQVSLMPLKFLDSEGSGVTSDAVDAIYYATAQGTFLTSNSWGGDGYSQSMADAILDANTHGSLFIAAAGNDGSDNETAPTYPASYDMPNIITVAAITRTGAMASFSNYGASSVHIGAPGLMIGSTAPDSYGTYIYASGTSMATPHISGACALLKSYRPALTALEVKSIILGTARPLESLAGKCATSGMLDLHAALVASDDLSIAPGGVFLAEAATPGGLVAPLTKSYSITNRSAASVTWTSTTSQAWLQVSPSSGSIAPGQAIPITATLSPSVSGFTGGSHEATLTITNAGSTRSQVMPVRVEIASTVVQSFALNTLPQGWNMTGEWAFGQPTGEGGKINGNPNTYGEADPTEGATGTNVFGVNLAGDYSIAIGGPHHLTTAAIDITGYQGNKLRFQRWLNSDFPPFATATVEASNDGATWTQLWINPEAEIAESAWSQHEYDLSAVADGHSFVYLRWSYSISFGAWPYSGWNIDDIQLLGTPAKRFILSLPSYVVSEGAGAQTVTLSTPLAPADDLLITLSLSDATQATLSSSTATILAGATSTTFTLTPTDDALLNGTRSVTLSASATGYIGNTTSVTINDNETANIAVSLPSFVTENAAPTTGLLTLSVAPDAPLVVHLASNDMTELLVPATVIVPAGETTQSFVLTMPNDDEIDGTQTVTISASVVGWTSTDASTEVRDNESLTLSVHLPSSIAENAGTLANAGEVSLSAATTMALTIALTSDHPTIMTVPLEVVIPAGRARANFNLTPINEPTATGHRTVVVTAEAIDFTSGYASTIVSDSQTPALPAQPSPVNLATGVNPDSDLAWVIPPSTGGAPESFDVYLGNANELGETELLGNVTSTSYPLPRLTRGATYYWRVVSHLGSLTAPGPVWQFNVPAIGPVHHFDWAAISSPQRVDVPFNATLTAKDEFGDTAVSFESTATLSTRGGARKMVITELNTGSLDEIEFTNISDTAVDMSGWKVVFYDESSWPFSLATLTLGNGTISAAGDVWRVQEFGTPVGAYPLYQIGMNINWTESSHAAIMLRDKDGAIVDFVIVGAPASVIVDPINVPENEWSGEGIALSNDASQMYLRIGDTDHNNATEWHTAPASSGIVNSGLTVPFPGAAGGTPINPTHTPTFVAGQWIGAVQVLRQHPSVRLFATDEANHSGTSNLLAIQPPPAPQLTAEPAFTGSTANTINWSSTSSGLGIDYEVQRAPDASFATNSSSGWLAALEHSFNGIPDGPQHYRVRARRASVDATSEAWTTAWSTPVSSIQDHSPPTLILTPTDGSFTALANPTITGSSSDLSGTSSITLAPASGPSLVPNTSDNFANWSQALSNLPVGESVFTITASDNMEPPNTGTTTWHIQRLSIDSPPTAEQVIDLFALATNTDPANPARAKPSGAAAIDNTNGKTYMTLTYRRRILPSGFVYIIETSNDLALWSSLSNDVETLSVTPNSDGLTETVTCRMTPALEESAGKFMRLRVELQ